MSNEDIFNKIPRFVKPSRSKVPRCPECGEEWDESVGYRFNFYHLDGKEVCSECFLDYFADYPRKKCECEVCKKVKDCIMSDTDERYYETGYEAICEDCLMKRHEV